MSDSQAAVAVSTSAETPRRPYSPPRLEVHGTAQDLTQGLGGGQGASNVDDA